MSTKTCLLKHEIRNGYIVKNIHDKINIKYDKYLTIDDYLKDNKLQKAVSEGEKYIVCENNHELITYESKKIKNHFKHKNSCNTGNYKMTQWHIDWQKKCKDIEIPFPKLKGGISNRKADALIGDNVLEFQHSYISESEVEDRSTDYLLHKKKLHWVIDCNDAINVINLEVNGNFMIVFENNTWKYENFISQNYIYLNVDDKVFRIKPKDVKSNMIDVTEYNLTDKFIKSFEDGNNIWSDKELHQCKLYYNQRGAGCGKTYESIQLLTNSDKFKHKETFLYLTKMHSAKEVIYNELKGQNNRGSLESLEIEEYVNGELCDTDKKQYKISYVNSKTKKYCTIIIGTIDSFMFAIRDKQKKMNGRDYFSEIVKSIKDGNISTTKKGIIKYAQNDTMLNKKCLIIIDEAQDLEPRYIEAMSEIMRNTYIDTYVIGDKLQSISDENNTHTFLEKNGLPNTTIIRDSGINKVRRFHNIQFKDFVNNIVDFEKWNLPPIESICDGDCKYTHEDDIKPYTLFKIEPIYKNDTNETKVKNEVEKIIKYVNDEVNKYGYLPKNFMFIFPILSKNYLADRLESRLQRFWINKFNNESYQNNVLQKDDYWKDKINDSKYYKYVYLHKSSEGKSIDLKESEKATRILSIHASKGNGCEVVFVLGLNEFSLHRFSKQVGNIVYDSLLHVAVTRQKKSLYVGLVDNGDDIWIKFNTKYNIEKDKDSLLNLRHIKKLNKYQEIIDCTLLNEDKFKEVNEMIIEPNNYKNTLPDNQDEKKIIDWGHHLIRYYVFVYNFMVNVVNNEKVDTYGDQFKAILHNRSKLNITCYTYTDYYKVLKDINDMKDKKNEPTEIPILYFEANERTKYIKYKDILVDFMKNIQLKIKQSNKTKKMPFLCPLETIIMYYMNFIIEHGIYSDISIMDVYSIMYCYDECSSSIDDTHLIYKCLCKQNFTEGDDNMDKYKEIRHTIKNHYEKTKQLDKVYNNYKKYISEHFKDSSKFTYNADHMILFGVNDNFKIKNNYDIIAHSDKYVLQCIVKPQFNELNFNDVMFNGIFNKYMIMNTKSDTNNYIRYNDKRVITCVLTLDSINPIFYEFNIDKSNIIIQSCIKDYLMKKYSEYHEKIYEFYEYCKGQKDKHINSITYTYNQLCTEKYNKLPNYIKNYFRDIQQDLNKNKSNKKTILMKVNNKDKFLDEIKDCLEEHINIFLGIYDEDDSDF